MFKSVDTVQCPVISWATTVQRVRMIPGSSNESEVCLYYDDKKRTSLLRADNVRSKLRAIVVFIGEDVLVFKKYYI